ncbi:MAG: hypothetical protein KatS3mg027_0156 [Bacteroidia bacterium]|nr:MAG: hypothetical protein KatS3mg027_0156 [Bacteroidia bacterium]
MTKNKKNILLCSATTKEIQDLIYFFRKKYHTKKIQKNFFQVNYNKHNIYILITGVGMVNTAFYLGTISNYPIDFAINAGIAGSFEKSLKIGEVVVVKEDVFSELGAEDGTSFFKTIRDCTWQ